jgi:hypothetical protein
MPRLLGWYATPPGHGHGHGGGGGGSAGGGGALSDPAYVEGYGKNATGGAGQTVYTVTSSAVTGAGTFDAAFDINIAGNAGVQNKLIQFAVSSFTASGRHVLGSNVTIDGTLNGQNGVIYDHSLAAFTGKHALMVVDPADNIIIRGINFRGQGHPSVEVGSQLNGQVFGGETTLLLASTANFNDPANWGHALSAFIGGFGGNLITYTGISGNNLTGVSGLTAHANGTGIFEGTEGSDNHIWLCSLNGGTLSNVLIDRCTFYQPANKSFDMTRDGFGIKRNVTVQRCLFIDASYDCHYKYSGPDPWIGISSLQSGISAGATSLTLLDRAGTTDNAAGFTTSGVGYFYTTTDVFTWSGKSGNTLTGIPSSGANAVGTSYGAGALVIQHGISKISGGAVSAGATSLTLVDATNFPASGAAWIAGEDRFTWTGKSTNTLTGIPSSGDSAMTAHAGTETVALDISATHGLRNYAISLHHNAYIKGGERFLGQIKDQIGLPTGHAIDPTNAGPMEVVNNVVYSSLTTPTAGYYITNYPDGTINSPYAIRLWSTDAWAQQMGTGRAGGEDTGDPTNGNVTINLAGNYFIGDAANCQVRTDGGADDSRMYIAADNTWTSSIAHPDRQQSLRLDQ